MVLFYLYPSSTPENCQFPSLITTLHGAFKGYQTGLFAGVGAGVLWAVSMRQNPQINTVFRDMTIFMRNTSYVGAGIGSAQAFGVLMSDTTENNAKRGFAIQHDIWHNRLDLLTVAGAGGGMVMSRQGVWQGLLRLQGMSPVWLGGVAWGSLLGLVCDIPMTVVGTIYYNHREDIAVIEQHDDDDDEEE